MKMIKKLLWLFVEWLNRPIMCEYCKKKEATYKIPYYEAGFCVCKDCFNKAKGVKKHERNN